MLLKYSSQHKVVQYKHYKGIVEHGPFWWKFSEMIFFLNAAGANLNFLWGLEFAIQIFYFLLEELAGKQKCLFQQRPVTKPLSPVTFPSPPPTLSSAGPYVYKLLLLICF